MDLPSENDVYVIVDNLPAPARKSVIPVKYPFAKLEIGQSFWIKNNDVNIKTVRSLCTKWGNKLKAKFVCVKHESGYLYVRRQS